MSEETCDLESVRLFISQQARRARATRSSAVEDVPGLRRVRSQHLEDGWMHLVFDGWDVTAAAEIANLVLEPDAATFLVLGPVSVFDGFAPVDEGGSGGAGAGALGPASAARGVDGRASLRLARAVPVGARWMALQT